MLNGTFKFVVTHPNGRREELAVDAERVLVGTGAHCEIRLPQGLAALEQLAIEPRAGGVFAEARALDPMPTLNGTPFTQGRLLPDAVIGIGPLSLQVELLELERGATARKESKERTSPAIYAAALLGFPLCFYILLHKRPETALRMPTKPPVLWAASPSTCPQVEAAPALAFAEQQLGAAESKEERSPFYPEDGVSAVKEFLLASACFQTADSAEQASDAERAALSLKKRVADDFHIHQVRLERALSTKSYESARVEVRILRAFLGGALSDYATWLSVLDRQIQIEFSTKKGKAK
ncbi:MAG: hypothetical protein ABW061_15130 [Polyangiaceae bacterium]